MENVKEFPRALVKHPKQVSFRKKEKYNEECVSTTPSTIYNEYQ